MLDRPPDEASDLRHEDRRLANELLVRERQDGVGSKERPVAPEQMVVLEVAEVEERNVRVLRRRRKNELAERSGSACLDIALVVGQDRCALLSDDDQDFPVGEDLCQPVRDLLAVVPARAGVTRQPLEGDDRDQSSGLGPVEQRFELRARDAGVEVRPARADDLPDRMVLLFLADFLPSHWRPVRGSPK
jgi:hypothetical protein